MPPRGKLTDE